MNRIAWGSAIAVCAVLALASCNTSSQPYKQATSMADGQFVESFLTTQFATSISNEVPLVIEETLSMGSLFDKTHEQFANELIQEVKDEDKRLLEAVREFCQKNAGTNSVESIGSIAVSHVVLTADQMKALFDTGGKDGWTEFYKTYPKSPGIITLSRPGFSKDGTLAVIYMGNQSQWLAGHGQIYVFEKKDGKWVEAMMWIGPSWVS